MYNQNKTMYKPAEAVYIHNLSVQEMQEAAEERGPPSSPNATSG